MDALLQEFCQLNSKNVFEPLDASTLTTSQKREALRAVNLIKEKRSGKLRGRTCANCWSQRSKKPEGRDDVSHGIHGRSHDLAYD